MGANAKMFVTVGEDKLYRLLEITVETLNNWQRSLLKKEVEKSKFETTISFLGNDENKRKWSTSVICDFYEPNTISIILKCGEVRDLKIISRCHEDYKEHYKGKKTILSLGYWGASDEIMKVLVEPLKELGEVFYDFNDCDEEDFIKM